jgi:hypothetical protein
MNDLDLIQRFRSDGSAPDSERVGAARARLMAEVRAATDANTTPAAGPRDRSDRERHRPRRVALRFGLPATAVVAAGTAGIVLVGSGISGGGTSTADAAIIHHAAAALAAPPNEIFHFELEGHGFVADSWQLTSAPYSHLGGKGPIGAVSYASTDGSTVAHYDPTTNTIDQTTSAKAARLAALAATDNPLAEIEQALQYGQARVLGTATVDGTATYEIQLADNNGFDSQSMIAYVDQSSYRPIEIAVLQSDGTTAHLRVVAFEYLPATPANLSLLSLTARYPNAQVVSNAPATGPTAATGATSATGATAAK